MFILGNPNVIAITNIIAITLDIAKSLVPD